MTTPMTRMLQLTRFRVDQIATEDALLLQSLEKAGAVFHVRTNQPQSLMVPQPAPIVQLQLTIKAPRLQQQPHRHDLKSPQPNSQPRRLIRRRRRLHRLQMRASRRRIGYWRLNSCTCCLLRFVRIENDGNEKLDEWD